MQPPKEFLRLFQGRVEIAPVLFQGKVTPDFIQQVRESNLKNMTFEGVVCKGGLDNRRRPLTFKIKSHAWLNKLKGKYGDNEALYKKLL
jgi:hypothetical protein